MTYGDAILELKRGNLIARQGWNGKRMFVFMRPEVILSVDQLVAVNTFPPKAKEYFQKCTVFNYVKFTAYLCMKAADDSIVNGWLASQTDMLADDWVIYNPE